MKKFYFALIGLIFSVQAYSQVEVRPDARLSEVFNAEQIKFMMNANPFLIQRYNFMLDNAWEIADLPAEKAQASGLPVIEVADLSRLNILLLLQSGQVKRAMEHPTVYALSGTNKMLIVLAEKELSRRLNAHLGRQ